MWAKAMSHPNRLVLFPSCSNMFVQMALAEVRWGTKGPTKFGIPCLKHPFDLAIIVTIPCFPCDWLVGREGISKDVKAIAETQV